jgi:antitoxin component of MazEF toxin-antitoxin module
MRDDVDAILSSRMTVSDKIRALDAAGYARAEIARLLDKRYQHVRNVLEGDKLSRAQGPARGVEERSADWSGLQVGDGVHRLVVDETGAVRLPAAVREALGLRAGGVAVAELQGDRLMLLSAAAAAQRARDLVTGLALHPDRRLSEELLEERRGDG